MLLPTGTSLSGFESELIDATKFIARAVGCQSVTVLEQVETPGTYLIRVVWDRIEDHIEGFRNSPDYGLWSAAIRPHLESSPVVVHFRKLH